MKLNPSEKPKGDLGSRKKKEEKKEKKEREGRTTGWNVDFFHLRALIKGTFSINAEPLFPSKGPYPFSSLKLNLSGAPLKTSGFLK